MARADFQSAESLNVNLAKEYSMKERLLREEMEEREHADAKKYSDLMGEVTVMRHVLKEYMSTSAMVSEEFQRLQTDMMGKETWGAHKGAAKLNQRSLWDELNFAIENESAS
eukprot:Platyproteum_vivax@DN4089_c0_g1_i3.p2